MEPIQSIQMQQQAKETKGVICRELAEKGICKLFRHSAFML